MTITLLPLACADCGTDIARGRNRKRCEGCQEAHRRRKHTEYEGLRRARQIKAILSEAYA